MAEIKIFRNLAGVKADIYHAADEPGAKDAAVLGKRPLVTTVHDVEADLVPESLNARGRAYMQLCRRWTRRSDMIIVPFDWTRRQVMSLYNVPPERIRIVNYGVDHDLFYPRRRAPSSRKKVLYVGELNRLKGVGVLLEAFGILLKEFKDVQMIFVGKGPDQGHLRGVARELQIDRDVIFTGFVPDQDLPIFYGQADVFVWPSRLGFGLTMLQAMASGLPVVASPYAEIPEFLEDSGIAVDCDSPEALADALSRLLSDEFMRTRMAERAIQKASAFSWERMAREVLAVYNEVLIARQESSRPPEMM